MAMREKAADEAKLSNSLNNLAALEYNLGRYAVAEPLYKRSLALTEKLVGPDDDEVASLLKISASSTACRSVSPTPSRC